MHALLLTLLAPSPSLPQDEAALFEAAAQHAYESFRDKAAESRGMSKETMQEVREGGRGMCAVRHPLTQSATAEYDKVQCSKLCNLVHLHRMLCKVFLSLCKVFLSSELAYLGADSIIAALCIYSVSMHDEFLELITVGCATGPQVAQGRVWSGRVALQRGLVDALGGVHTAVELVKQAAGRGRGVPCPGAVDIHLSLLAWCAGKPHAHENTGHGCSQCSTCTAVRCLQHFYCDQHHSLFFLLASCACRYQA
jgi:hypothetical protein